VRVAGSGHSCNDSVPTDGHLLTIAALDRVLDVDRESGLVRVEAGITLRALNRELDAVGLALPNLGSIDLQTLAGAIATDTHGSGLHLPNLAGQVEAVELVTASGEVIEIDGDDPAGLRAARVSLGALGVVTAVTLRCVPAFAVEESESPMPRDEVLARLDELLERNEHYELWAFPHSDVALVTERNRTERPPSRRGAAATWIDQVLMRNYVLSAACKVARTAPRLGPPLTRTTVGAARPARRVDVSHRIFAGPRLLPVVESEWAVPLEAAATVLEETLRLLREARYPVPLPIGCRFGGATDAALSLAAGRRSAYVDVLIYRGLDWRRWVEPIEELMDGLGGRPHWGKRFAAGAGSLAPRYPDWDAFQDVRTRLDPEGRFANGYVERVLGPVRTTEPAR
jgi:L-gulono-1,4-lactone dehydrogenase